MDICHGVPHFDDQAQFELLSDLSYVASKYTYDLVGQYRQRATGRVFTVYRHPIRRDLWAYQELFEDGTTGPHQQYRKPE